MDFERISKDILWLLARLIVVIIPQYVQILNHSVVHLKVIYYLPIILQLKKRYFASQHPILKQNDHV